MHSLPTPRHRGLLLRAATLVRATRRPRRPDAVHEDVGRGAAPGEDVVRRGRHVPQGDCGPIAAVRSVRRDVETGLQTGLETAVKYIQTVQTIKGMILI